MEAYLVHPKLVKHRNEKYLEWIRQQPSIISKTFDAWDEKKGEGRNEGHHAWNTGKKGKRNDYLAVPLTREQHTEVHHIGHLAFQEKYNFDWEWEIMNLMSEYIESYCKFPGESPCEN